MANSSPVVIASDQTSLEVSLDSFSLSALENITLDGGSVTVSNFPATQPVSLSSQPLPTGAATEATLSNIFSAFKAEDSVAVSGDLGMPLLAIRSSTDAVTASHDGDYTNLAIDEEGRLKVASKPASYPDITGDITAVQATINTPVAGGTVSGDVSRASNLMVFCTGTFSTVNCTFEGSLESTGDANWFGVQAVRSNANTIETATGNLSAQPVYAWEASVNALKRFRVRCTARTSGTQSWRFVQGTYATEPIPAAQVTATQPVSGTVTATVANASLSIPSVIADIASAAITTTTTTGPLAPTFGTSYRVAIPVTAASGTNPTLDIGIEESDDTGTNWFRVYDFPRITSTGFYRSPNLVLRGNRVRYVQTVTGTTPSFTRAINRLQRSDSVRQQVQFIDRTIVLNTLNSTTPSYYVEGCTNFNLNIRTTSQVSAATVAMQFSMDGANWMTSATVVATVAGIVSAKYTNEQWKFARAIVTLAGSTAVLGELVISGVGE
jgi:hypothetical protein